MTENTATYPDRPRCIVCGQEGKPQLNDHVPVQPKGTVRKVKTRTRTGSTLVLESGDLTIGHMVGPGSPPSNFPGDFSMGASAYVQYHPECNGYTLEGYNAFLQTISVQMADDEDWLYDHEKPASEGPWRGSPRPSEAAPRAVPIPDPLAPGVRP